MPSHKFLKTKAQNQAADFRDGTARMIACLRPDYRLLDAVFGNFLLIMSGTQNIQSKKLSIIHRNDLFSIAFRLSSPEYLTRQAEREMV